MDVDDLCVNALCLQLFGSIEDVLGHHAADEDAQVLAFLHDVGLEEVELIVLGEHNGLLLAEQADVHGAVIVVQHGHGRTQLHLVDRLENDHAGDRANHADVLHAHVGAAVELGRNAGVGADDLDVALGIGDRNRHLVADAARGKGGEALNPGLEAVAGKAGRDRGHVLLGNAAVKALLGELLAQAQGSAGLAQVRVQNHDVSVFFHQFRKACGINSSHFHGFSPPL